MMDIEKRPGKHRWIHYYEPPPDVVCFRFPVLSWANGCPYSCSYCYLQHTLRRQKSKMVVWTDYDAMEKQIRNWLKRRKKPELLNAGELADSLGIEVWSTKFLEAVRWGLGEDVGLYLLTKSDGRRLWSQFGHRANWVIAFSVNADPAAQWWEKDAPSPDMRLAGARMLKDRGWPVRIRIDPMVPFPGWQAEYENVAEIVKFIKPERVTLGSLRANSGLRAKLPEDLRGYLSDDFVGGKYRIAPEDRAEMYRFIGERLDMPFSLCKETKAIWRESGAKGPCVCLP